MADKLDVFTHFAEEVQKLNSEVDYIRGSSDYFYTDVMTKFKDRYNNLLRKYKDHTGIPLEMYKIYEHEYSSTGKTVRDQCIERFTITLKSTKKLLDQKILDIRNSSVKESTPLHQMRKCLKIGVEGCPKNPQLDNNKVFVGMPFADEYLDSYKYGIEIALNQCGLESFRADEKISNVDVMCKICEQMQICKYLIFNISGLNPNVMLELGLSYGLGKETMIIKDKKTTNISDLANSEYIEYAHAGELQEKLVKFFTK